VRSLRHAPAFTTMAVLCVGARHRRHHHHLRRGRRVLLRPLPFPHAEQLVAIYASQPQHDSHRVNISRPDFDDWQRANRTFAAIGMYNYSTLTFTGAVAKPERRSAPTSPPICSRCST
jgi:putative ABC transport system permease protein